MEDAVTVGNVRQYYRSLHEHSNTIATNRHKHNSHLQTISFGHVLSKLWILCLAYCDMEMHATSRISPCFNAVTQNHSVSLIFIKERDETV